MEQNNLTYFDLNLWDIFSLIFWQNKIQEDFENLLEFFLPKLSEKLNPKLRKC